MKENNITLFLIGIVVGGALGFVGTTWLYPSKNHGLQTAFTNLTTQYETLLHEYNSTLIDNEYLSHAYDDLKAEYVELQQEFEEITEADHASEECLDVVLLANQEYYHTLKADLVNAKDSIMVVMYSMKYDPDDSFDWANDLIEELVYAHNRDVKVSVFLEYQTFFGTQDENYDAYDYLSANGVDVHLDYEDDTDHTKFVMIDGSILYIGSHNWSESSLYYNNEVSVKITEK